MRRISEVDFTKAMEFVRRDPEPPWAVGRMPYHPEDSPIEAEMGRILAEAPFFHSPAAFGPRRLPWREAMELTRAGGERFGHASVAVFPQSLVEAGPGGRETGFRSDFLVVVGCPAINGGFRRGFFVECDGREFHGDFPADRRRHDEISLGTRMEVLHFGGEEVLYAKAAVRQVLDAYVETWLARETQLCGAEAEAVLGHITDNLAALPRARESLLHAGRSLDELRELMRAVPRVAG